MWTEILRVVLVFCAVGPGVAQARCLTEAEVEAAVGNQIRAKAMFITVPQIADRPLCSGLTLAQQIQRMREITFPDERVAREAEEARLRALQQVAANEAIDVQNASTNAMAGQEVANVGDVVTATEPKPAENKKAKLSARASAPAAAVADFDKIIANDAAGWMMNRYDRGSMKNMRVVGSSNGGRTKTVYGEYTYNGGTEGWVKARFANLKLECLEFWDFAGQCRPPGRSPSQGLAAGFVGALAIGMMADTSSTKGSPDDNNNCSLKPVDTNGAGGVVYGMRC